eukprot:CAMPEP_0179444636 /NCGR_PEP_ID=MMETSP0799-20121207/28074_1 /TAXON_ID=46947 /ORGANISM="Geminigera cryophila, Strain CCMP2564" /LENGTH=45 /DNA_ID= /DNA_START= /DNA_END= /DNA_ORIENTATION=
MPPKGGGNPQNRNGNLEWHSAAQGFKFAQLCRMEIGTSSGRRRGA